MDGGGPLRRAAHHRRPLLRPRPPRAGRGAGDPGDYYAFLGEWAEGIISSAATTPEQITEHKDAFEAIGVDGLIFDPTIAGVDQVDRLAQAAL